MCVHYRWGAQCRGGYHEYREDILSTVGMLSTVGDNMMHVGDIMSTVGGFSTVEDTTFCCLSTPQY